MLYTKDERYTVKRSFYSNKISTSNSAVHASQYLTITVDAEEKRQLEQQMKVRERQRITAEEQPKLFLQLQLFTNVVFGIYINVRETSQCVSLFFEEIQ